MERNSCTSTHRERAREPRRSVSPHRRSGEPEKASATARGVFAEKGKVSSEKARSGEDTGASWGGHRVPAQPEAWRRSRAHTPSAGCSSMSCACRHFLRC